MSFVNVKTAEQVEAERLQMAENNARTERDKLLKETDYIVMPDYPMVDKSAFETYRQELRDIPLQAGFPDSIAWPTKPA